MIAQLAPDTALKELLDGQVYVQTSATKGYILKTYGQDERPNIGLDNEFIEIYNNGIVQSMTKPLGMFKGNLALVVYVRANSNMTAKKDRTMQILSQVEKLVSNKKSGDYFFEFNPTNVITPTTTNLTTGYATTVFNISWRCST